MFLILRKSWMNFFNEPKFGESCWNFHMIAVHSRTVCVAIRGKKDWQNSLRLFCRFHHYFAVDIVHYFAIVGKIDIISFERECSYTLCPNIVNFCPNNGQFFSLRMRPHPLHPHTVRLWALGIRGARGIYFTAFKTSGQTKITLACGPKN